MLSLAFSSPVTPLCLDEEHFNLDWQHHLMKSFFRETTDDFIYDISHGTRSTDYCTYKGVSCEGDVVKEVKFNFLRDKGQLDIHSAPPTVRWLVINVCQQKSFLRFKCLPRELQQLDLHRNAYYGSLDFASLPRKLVHVIVSNNKLYGPITFAGLPPELKTLNICKNILKQDVVYYEEIPDTLKRIILFDFLDQVVIGKIAPLPGTEPVTNRQIFRMFPNDRFSDT